MTNITKSNYDGLERGGGSGSGAYIEQWFALLISHAPIITLSGLYVGVDSAVRGACGYGKKHPNDPSCCFDHK